MNKIVREEKGWPPLMTSPREGASGHWPRLNTPSSIWSLCLLKVNGGTKLGVQRPLTNNLGWSQWKKKNPALQSGPERRKRLWWNISAESGGHSVLVVLMQTALWPEKTNIIWGPKCGAMASWTVVFLVLSFPIRAVVPVETNGSVPNIEATLLHSFPTHKSSQWQMNENEHI